MATPTMAALSMVKESSRRQRCAGRAWISWGPASLFDALAVRERGARGAAAR
jgi:hypothetical protein